MAATLDACESRRTPGRNDSKEQWYWTIDAGHREIEVLSDIVPVKEMLPQEVARQWESQQGHVVDVDYPATAGSGCIFRVWLVQLYLTAAQHQLEHFHHTVEKVTVEAGTESN